MDDSFSSVIEAENSLIILLPTKPYFDQVAAGLSLYLALREKKEVTISCPSPILVEFNRLVGVNKISQEFGNKNLVIKFADYDAKGVERVSADIENQQFYLTVIPKPGFTSPKKEQVQLSYSGLAAGAAILVGGANESHFPALSSKDLLETKLIHIGTRMLSVSPNLSVISFARPASSISELVATLIKESGFSLDADIATTLLMGIEEGTNNYSNPEVTADTFEIVANLIRAGGQRKPKVTETRRTFRPGAVPGQKLKIEPKKKPPKDWLEPKIYKGTTIS
jgi:hypothetical protein